MDEEHILAGLERSLMPTDEDPGGAASHYARRIEEAKDFCNEIWEKSLENHQFADKGGEHQWDRTAYRRRQASGRPCFSISDTSLAVNALSGMEITSRFERVFRGQEGGDHRVAEALTKADRKIRDRGGWEHVESDKFRDLGIEGYSALEVFQDFLDDPRGTTKVRGVDTWSMIWDPAAREGNLVDRLWDAHGRWMSIDEFLALYPDSREEIRGAVMTPSAWTGVEDTHVHRWPWLHVCDGRYVEPNRRDVFLVDYEWKEREPVFIVPTPQEVPTPDGAVRQVMTYPIYSPEEWDAVKSATAGRIDESGVVGPKEGAWRWRYRAAKILGDLVLEEGDAPVQGFSRLWMTGFPYKQIDRVEFQGLVDGMKDPQRFKNHLTSLVVSILQRSPKGGFAYDPSAFDPATLEDLENELAKPMPLLKTKRGALAQGRRIFEEMTNASFPNGLEAYLSVADQAVWRPTGMNPNVLGQLQDPRRVSGRVFASLAEAGQMVMSYLFNSLRLYRQMSGQLQLQFFREFYDPEQLRELVGPELAPDIPDKSAQDVWRDLFRQDVLVDESAANTKDDRERIWELMTRQGVDRILDSGLVSRRTIVSNMPGISESDRAYELERIELEEGIEKLQAQLQELQTAVEQAQQGQQGQQQ